MQDEQDKLISDQFKSLPLALQRAIVATPWKSIVGEIGATRGLNVDSLRILEQETMFVLFGFEPPQKYIDNLQEALGLDESTVLDIAESVKTRIFDPVSAAAADKMSDGGHQTTTEQRSERPQVPEVAPEIHPAEAIQPPANLPGVDQPNSAPNPERYQSTDPYREPLE